MVKISVLVPVFNSEKYLYECLESIASQTLNDIEVLCINDGSTDSSELIIDQFVDQFDFFHKLNKPNSGYGASLNFGLKCSTGEYISIIESDDFIEPNMMEVLYAVASSRQTDITKAGYWDFYDDFDGQRDVIAPIMEYMNPPFAVFDVHDYENIISYYHPSIWSALYDRNFLEKNNIKFQEPKGASWADNPFFFETMNKAKRISWVNVPLYHYRRTNLESSSYLKDCNIPIDRLNEMFDVVESNNVTDINVLACLYGRSFMYVRGILDNPNFIMEEMGPKIKHLFSRMDYTVLEKRGFNEEDKMFYKYWTNDHLDLFDKMEKIHSIATIHNVVRHKIMFYNWAQYDEKGSPGGGVTKYLYNLISHIVRNYEDVDVYFLSSGYRYNTSTTETYLRKTNNRYDGRCFSFEIVNSPVPAPAYLNCRNPKQFFDCECLKNIFRDFILKYGEFDSIYFANIEGMTLSVVDLKDEFKNTNFIMGLHNYIPVCPEVFYFRLPDRCVCKGIINGANCLECINSRNEHLKDDLGWRIYQSNHQRHPIEWSEAMGFEKLEDSANSSVYDEYHSRFVHALSKMDYCLAVSKRVEDIFVNNGFNPDNIHVSYIGTLVANNQLGRPANYNHDSLKIVFLGYADMYEKGFTFLLDCLNQLDADYASKIEIRIAAIGSKKYDYSQLSKYRKVTVTEGYTHGELPEILNNSNLGIIPVLWEDNLPQVALEMVAYGVPILSSDLGGASELCDSDLFKFKGGDKNDFIDHLKYFVDNPLDLESYWSHHKGLTTMAEHAEDINKYLFKNNLITTTVSESKQAGNEGLLQYDSVHMDPILKRLLNYNNSKGSIPEITADSKLIYDQASNDERLNWGSPGGIFGNKPVKSKLVSEYLIKGAAYEAAVSLWGSQNILVRGFIVSDNRAIWGSTVYDGSNCFSISVDIDLYEDMVNVRAFNITGNNDCSDVCRLISIRRTVWNETAEVYNNTIRKAYEGDADSMVKLANFLSIGYATSRNYELAADWLILAVRYGKQDVFPELFKNLWACNTRRTHEAAARVSKMLADFGDGSAAASVSRDYYDGVVLPKDLEKSVEYAILAKSAGYNQDNVRLYDMLLDIGTSDAIDNMRTFSEDDPEAKARLAIAYLRGIGVDVDIDKSIALISESLNAGVEWIEPYNNEAKALKNHNAHHTDNMGRIRR